MSAAASAGLGKVYRPYETDSETESDEGSLSVSESGSDEEIDRGRVSHEGRGAAHDDWALEARRWITSQNRVGAGAERVLPGRSLAQPLPPPASALDLPLELRANDIKRHIINIDSQFREVPAMTSAANFYFRLVAPVRNVMRIRVTSVEAPNNYYIFSAARRNIYLLVTVGATTELITIDEGNYTAGDMADSLQAALVATFPAAGFTVTFSEITGKFTITATSAFSINTTPSGGDYWFDRSFVWGLGANLGFRKGTILSNASGGTWSISSDSCAHFAGDNYLLLCVNDFECVRQTVATTDSAGLVQVNEIKALAKLVLREPKNYVAFDDYASQHIKEVVFPAPRDLERLHVRLLDPYGEPVPLCSSQFSFSLEVLEIQNPTLFDTVRDAIMVRYV
jgi:hypothetical protein